MKVLLIHAMLNFLHPPTLNAIKLVSFPCKRESTTIWKIWIPNQVGNDKNCL